MADMKKQRIAVTVKALSPISLGSGQSDVIVDCDVVHNDMGVPYFPAKRFKGLLYESALEVVEMLESSGIASDMRQQLALLFHRDCESDIQLIINDLQIFPDDEWENFNKQWRYLSEKYPSIISAKATLEEFTSLRYQTKLKNGVAEDTSLRNLRVVREESVFYGNMLLVAGNERIIQLLALAMRNLISAGAKRNRGFGTIECELQLEDGRDTQMLVDDFWKEAM